MNLFIQIMRLAGQTTFITGVTFVAVCGFGAVLDGIYSYPKSPKRVAAGVLLVWLALFIAACALTFYR